MPQNVETLSQSQCDHSHVHEPAAGSNTNQTGFYPAKMAKVTLDSYYPNKLPTFTLSHSHAFVTRNLSRKKWTSNPKAVEAVKAEAAGLSTSREQSIPSDAFVQQVLASLDLRDRNMLQRHAQRFLSCLPEAIRPFLDAWVAKKVISGSSLTRGRLYLDLAMQLIHREHLAGTGPFLKYAWGDSTAKYGLEIYNARYRFLPKAQCVELARMWRYLCTHPWTRDMEEEAQALRAHYSQKLFDSVLLHTQVPQMLGSKRTSLVDKASAHVHSSLLEVSSLEELESSFANHVSWCSDMGVESGLPSFHATGVETTLPEWLRPARVHVFAGDQDDYFEDGAVLPIAQSKAFMPSAFTIPGICHAIHNATASLETAFVCFERFNEKFEVVYKFLGNSQRRERFVEVVMKGTPQYEVAKTLFSKEIPSFYTKRWNALAECLSETLPLANFLRCHWDHVRYCEGSQHNPSVQDGWAPEQINPVLEDPFFFLRSGACRFFSANSFRISCLGQKVVPAMS